MGEASEEGRLGEHSGGAVPPVGTEKTWTGDLRVLWVSPDLGIPGLLALQQQAVCKPDGQLGSRAHCHPGKETQAILPPQPSAQEREGGPSPQGFRQITKKMLASRTLPAFVSRLPGMCGTQGFSP